MANKSQKAKGADCRTKRSAGSQQRVVMARLLYETEKRACDKTGGEVWMAYPTWEQVSKDMKQYYEVVARNFSRSILKRHNAEVRDPAGKTP